MTPSLSDTLATANDTVAGVKILEPESITDSTLTDSAAAEEAMAGRDMPVDILDTARLDCYADYTIQLPTDSGYDPSRSVILRQTPGVYGIPADSSMVRSDMVTTLVLALFFITITIFSVARSYISRQTKRFFNSTVVSGSLTAETVSEARYSLYFVIQTCVLLALTTYIYATRQIGTGHLPFSPELIISAASAGYMVYFLIKYILCMTADGVFIDDRNVKRHHTDDICYIITLEGLLLFPVLLISISTGMSTASLATYVSIVIIIAKLLAFYKASGTFSGHYKSILQIILYFCALEMIPLMSLCGILVMIAKYL